MNPAADIEVSIVMPCLNEEESIRQCIRMAQEGLERAGAEGEIVIADNGSTDGSQEIARELGARVVDVPAKGYGAALMGGFEAARGRYVIMGDADGSYDFGHVEAFLERLRAGDDLVMGNRFRGGIAEGAMPFLHRYLGNPVLSFVGRLLFPSAIGDFHCGLRGFSREAVLGLELDSSGMEFASEMVVKATISELKVTEVPTTLSPDGRSRPPHLRSWRDGWRHLKLLLEFAPHWLFLYPGGALACMGALIAAALIPGPLELGRMTLDTATLLLAVAAVLVGTQLVLFYAVAKVAAVEARLLPASPRYERMIGSLTVDRFCLAGGILFAIGFAIAAFATVFWMTTGFGDLNAAVNLRLAAYSALGMALGVQCVTAGFLIGLVRRQRRGGQAEKPMEREIAAPKSSDAQQNKADDKAA